MGDNWKGDLEPTQHGRGGRSPWPERGEHGVVGDPGQTMAHWLLPNDRGAREFCCPYCTGIETAGRNPVEVVNRLPPSTCPLHHPSDATRLPTLPPIT